ncbi:O-methyltransferase [Rhynchospora pubera]|uniref:O-methyltransferase n=1 Tax=Rhynchospora pubera TaxID=906938 RepID=A0AAV8FBN4_9POAL|nr:O-methyltransferase [Rhynchospora pubera]
MYIPSSITAEKRSRLESGECHRLTCAAVPLPSTGLVSMENKEPQAVAELMNMALGFIKPMSLKCALDLGIADQIYSHGRPMTLSQLQSALSLPQSKEPHLRHLMRILTHFGFIQMQIDANTSAEPIYDITPMSSLVTNKEGSLNLVSLVRFRLESIEENIKALLCMAEWLKQGDNKQTPFEMAHGCRLWEMASENSRLNESFNSSMASTTSLFTNVIIKSGGDIFKGIESLVDVGGGIGKVAKSIASNFPHVKCTVLDLPHVVRDLANDGVVKFVSGNMFDYIPPADAILLKFVLHNWGDDDCIKILKRCKEAISSTEAGGKVIIVDAVVGRPRAREYEETQLLLDMLMISVHAGAERDENEWESLFTKAGFSSYNIARTIGLLSVIEVYP